MKPAWKFWFCWTFLMFLAAPARGDQTQWQSQTDAGNRAYADGNYENAENFFAAALKTAQASDKQDARLATSLNNLAEALRAQSERKLAEPLYKQAIDIQEKVLGADDLEVAKTATNLAKLYRGWHKYDDAEPLFKRAISIREKKLGPDDPAVAKSLVELAEFYRDQENKLDACEPLYQRALAIREKAFGPNDPSVAEMLNRIATLYRVQKKYAAAEPLLRRSLAIEEKAFGPDDPRVAHNYSQLASLYKYQNDFASAEPFLRRSMEIRDKAMGPEPIDRATSLQAASSEIGLAENLQAQGKFDLAEPLYLKALGIRRKVLGPDDPTVARSLNDLAEFYRVQNKLDKAEPLFKQALAIREKALGPEHYTVARSLLGLAKVYRAQGKSDAAEPLYQRAITIEEKVWGKDHPSITTDRESYAAVLAAAKVEPQTQPAKPLNVLYIVADDLNVDLSCYAHPIVHTPNIDRLAARGVKFDRAYCNYPVCNPSRTSFLSGKRPDTTGVIDNNIPTRAVLKDAVMMPQFFRQHGWLSQKVGKIFHTGDDHEDPASWDKDIRETAEAKKPPDNQIIRKLKGTGIILNADDADTWDGKVARQAVTMLEQAARGDKPFFIAAGFRRPHAPYIAPQKYYDMYPPAKMTWPSEPAEHLAGIPPIALTYAVGKPALPEPDRAEVIASYLSSISFMDAQVGVLIDAMDRLKLWDKTIVVFHSDHGYQLGEHGGLWHKMTLFEEGTRVPLIMVVPGAKVGVVSPRLVELVDMYPTLADLCGLTPPVDLEGFSFRPLLSDPQRPWKTGAFTVVGRRRDGQPITATEKDKLELNYLGRTVRSEKWRYTEWPNGAAELYDQENDPREYVNLANKPEAAATREEMIKILHAGWKAALPK